VTVDVVFVAAGELGSVDSRGAKLHATTLRTAVTSTKRRFGFITNSSTSLLVVVELDGNPDPGTSLRSLEK
jgi:hypothetical protein